MNHPGPPRFVSTGDRVELAPRDPDPTASYRWRLVQLPHGSTVELGDDPVEHLVPDEPGTYVARLATSEGEHEQTIRAFSREDTGSDGSAVLRSSGSGRKTHVGTADESETETYADASSDSVDEFAGGRPRVVLEASVTDDHAVIEADPRPHPSATETAAALDVEFLIDDRDDVDPSAVETVGHELRLPLASLPEQTRVYAVAIGHGGISVPAAIELTRDESDGDTIETDRPYHPPEWAGDSIVYEVYVRTFDGGDEDSTLADIVDRLDYIASLGVDVLWLTPVLQNDHAPHGYNITDMFAIASDLGTRDDYERLVEAAHDRGLKVLFDLVCNHSARTHPHFQAAVEDPESQYREWYEWQSDTEPETYFGWEHIANYNFDHLPVRRHLLDAVDEWAPLVDGFRCDMAWAVPNGFWRELHDRCKAADSEFLLLDETIPYISDFQAGLFDMHFDSMTYHELRQIGHGQDAETLLGAVDNRAAIGFPEYSGFLLYAENHDESRYLADCGRPAAEAALGALFTLPGAPLLYAGQEFGQLGKRDDLAWDHADETLQAFVRSLTAVRGGCDALSADAALDRVPYEVHAGAPDRVVAFERSDDDEGVVVVLNFGADPATVSVPADAADTDLVSGALIAADGDDGHVRVDSVAVLPRDRV